MFLKYFKPSLQGIKSTDRFFFLVCLFEGLFKELFFFFFELFCLSHFHLYKTLTFYLQFFFKLVLETVTLNRKKLSASPCSL